MAIKASFGCSLMWMSRISDQKIIYEILGLSIDLIYFKMNIYYVTRSLFCKGLSKGLM
jgi:hypothetical protein